MRLLRIVSCALAFLVCADTNFAAAEEVENDGSRNLAKNEATEDTCVSEDCLNATSDETEVEDDFAISEEEIEDGDFEEYPIQEPNETQDDPLVDNIAWEDITGTLTMVRPLPDSEVVGGTVAVHLNVNTNCVNGTRFQEKFNNSNVCISIDESPLSCWPLFKISRLPLFNNLSVGEHTLLAEIIDPDQNHKVIEESILKSTFVVVPKPEESESNTKEKENEANPENEDQDSEKPENKTETISIPRVGITHPSEDVAVPGTFEVQLNVMTAANLTQFRRLFAEAFICLSLDESVHQSCWPIFEETYYPKFYDLEPGMHSLESHLTHPNTLETLPFTSMGVRTFWVAERNRGVVPMTLREPSAGSHAFPEELQQQAREEEMLKRGPLPDDTESAAQAALAEAKLQQQKALLEQQKALLAQQEQALLSHKNAEKGSLAEDKPVEGEKSHVSLHINVDGVRHILTVYEGEDFLGTAARFCMERNVIGQSCVASITKLIEFEWKKHYEIPHIELYSRT